MALTEEQRKELFAKNHYRGGRKVGTKNKVHLTQEMAMQIAGMLPKEVMLEGMAYWVSRVRKLQAEGRDERLIAEAYKEAKDFAVAVAPFCHSKLAAIEHTGKNGGPIKVESNAREKLERLLAGRVAARAADGDPKSIN